MKIDVITLFPEVFGPAFTSSMLGRAQQAGHATLRAHDLRSFTTDKHRTVDDTPYGGGAGMVLKPDPIFSAIEHLRGPASQVIFLTPQGTPYTQAHAVRLAQKEHLILLCGHYEGVDERVLSVVDERISIGDYILTGGEPAAWVIVDSVVRLIPGVLSEASLERESFNEGLLEGPQYTRPPVFRGMEVPAELLSGNHEAIRRQRRKEALRRTLHIRPDLVQESRLSTEDKILLFEIRSELQGEGDDHGSKDSGT